ncbi:MAG: transglutaminaseTgpA domain-containing protein [Gemmatimonadota bacterium]|nr:transglutaminaseTgpA domain-containing protein [Gemmatimonadota bacterium]
MNLALLHRRLTTLMALAALAAFGAGHGLNTPEVVLTAALLAAALVWQPPASWNLWIERAARLVVIVLFGWILQVTFLQAGDFLVPVLALLLFLLAVESLRPLETRNDLRLYSLSFGLLIAATAYYPGLLFAAGFIGFVALATLALMIGHLRRKAEHFRIAHVPVGRSFLAATAALSGVTLLMSAALFAFFPRVQRHWLGPARGGAQQTMVGFGETISLGGYGSRISPNPEVVFRVEFPSRLPPETGELHWRGRSFDHFDGVRWTRTPALPHFAPPAEFYRERWGDATRSYQIYGGPPGVRVLFGLHPIYGIAPRSAIRPIREGTGDVSFGGLDSPVYQVTSAAALPPPSVLRAAPEPNARQPAAYLQLPRLDPRVARLADSLTRAQTTRYDRARAVERYLRSEFGYTLDLPATRRETSLEHFLFVRREGHCEYFSTAMVVLLRTLGIPARNVNGFLGGEWNESARYLAVTQNDAHSWVEVWFPQVGWVPFDPTPAADRSRVAGTGATLSWQWPLRFWLDGLEHRWYKWVLYYDLEKQLRVFREVSSVFSRSPVGGPRAGGALELRRLLPWAAVLVVIFLLAWLAGGRRRAPLSAEARLYLALRQVYSRAGHAPPGAETPLALLAALRRADAPGIASAERLVSLYLRARFAGEEIGADGRAEMQDALAEVRRSLRAARRPRSVYAISG